MKQKLFVHHVLRDKVFLRLLLGMLAFIAISSVILFLLLFLWIGRWTKYTDPRGFSLRYPQNWYITTYDGTLNAATGNRQSLILLQELNLKGSGPDLLAAYRFSKAAKEDNNLDGLVYRFLSYYPDIPDLFHDLRLSSTLVNWKLTKVISVRDTPQDSYESLTNHYLVDTAKYTYNIDAFERLTGLTNWERIYYGVILRLIVATFSFNN